MYKNYKLFIYNTCSDLYWHNRDEEGEKAVFELMNFSMIDIVMIHTESFRDKEVVSSGSQNRNFP